MHKLSHLTPHDAMYPNIRGLISRLPCLPGSWCRGQLYSQWNGSQVELTIHPTTRTHLCLDVGRSPSHHFHPHHTPHKPFSILVFPAIEFVLIHDSLWVVWIFFHERGSNGYQEAIAYFSTAGNFQCTFMIQSVKTQLKWFILFLHKPILPKNRNYHRNSSGFYKKNIINYAYHTFFHYKIKMFLAVDVFLHDLMVFYGLPFHQLNSVYTIFINLFFSNSLVFHFNH